MLDTIFKYALQILAVVIICVITNKVMAPKEQTTFDFDPNTAKIKEMRDIMKTMDMNIFQQQQVLQKLKTKIDTTHERIVIIKQNKGVNNRIISNYSSNELARILTERYKDSIR